MESKLSPNSAALINKITELEETTEVRFCLLVNLSINWRINYLNSYNIFSDFVISKSVISQTYPVPVLVS